MTKTNESIKQELMPINCQKSSNVQIPLAEDSSRDPLELSSEEVEAITDRNVYEERGVITGKLTQSFDWSDDIEVFPPKYLSNSDDEITKKDADDVSVDNI